jgi:ankyrin repeat protein
MTDTLTLRGDEPLAVELTGALKHGEVDRLCRLLAANPGLAHCVVENPKSGGKGGGRTPLHLSADWPGHNSNAVDIVRTLAAAGADLDAPAVGMRHRETPLHWAASNDDVALIDALLDAGADIERAGSSIDGGSPLSCAVGYGQWAAARRLVERGARTAALARSGAGIDAGDPAAARSGPPPQPEELSGPLWNACHGGQLAAAQYLLVHGADLNWPAPWSGQTPLDIAEQEGRSDIVAWLLGKGGIRGSR